MQQEQLQQQQLQQQQIQQQQLKQQQLQQQQQQQQQQQHLQQQYVQQAHQQLAEQQQQQQFYQLQQQQQQKQLLSTSGFVQASSDRSTSPGNARPQNFPAELKALNPFQDQGDFATLSPDQVVDSEFDMLRKPAPGKLLFSLFYQVISLIRRHCLREKLCNIRPKEVSGFWS